MYIVYIIALDVAYVKKIRTYLAPWVIFAPWTSNGDERIEF